MAVSVDIDVLKATKRENGVVAILKTYVFVERAHGSHLPQGWGVDRRFLDGISSSARLWLLLRGLVRVLAMIALEVSKGPWLGLRGYAPHGFRGADGWVCNLLYAVHQM